MELNFSKLPAKANGTIIASDSQEEHNILIDSLIIDDYGLNNHFKKLYFEGNNSIRVFNGSVMASTPLDWYKSDYIGKVSYITFKEFKRLVLTKFKYPKRLQHLVPNIEE